MGLIRPGRAVMAVAAGLAIACNALTGVGDLEATGLDEGLGDGGFGDAPVALDAAGSSSSSGGTSSGALSCTTIGGTCAPQAPPTWRGPYLVQDANGSNGAPATCPAQLEDRFERGTGTPSSTFACPTCKCQSPSGGTCSATLTVWPDSTVCSDVAASTTADPSVCFPNSNTTAAGAKFRHAVTAVGKCDPALSGPPTRGPVSWTASYLFCGSMHLTAIGCDTQDEVCLPPVANAKVCIYHEGAANCPGPWVAAEPVTVYADVNDSRACDATGCSCATPTGVSCFGQYRTTPNTTCTVPIFPPFGTTRAVDTCFVLEAGASAKQVNPPTTTGGSCAASGTPGMTGSLVPAAPGTMCCLP